MPLQHLTISDECAKIIPPYSTSLIGMCPPCLIEVTWPAPLNFDDRLCEACSVIRFDDGQFGGCAGEDGHLHFPDDEEGKEFNLGTTHKDSLPLLPSMKASAEAGCSFCGALRDAVLTLDLRDYMEVVIDLSYYWRPKYTNVPGLYRLLATVTAKSKIPGNEDYMCQRMFLVDSEQNTCSDWLQLQPAPRKQALAPENLNMLQEAMEDCIASCDHPQPSEWIPTRLIDLEADNSIDGMRLIETRTACLQKPFRYVALSYCWGPKEMAELQPRTTSNTQSTFLAEIPMSCLTPTLRDAVLTTRALSIRYIWIDALCIIQDNQQDWARESQQMGSVYSNAHLTICTQGTSSCLESFLARPEAVKPIRDRLCTVFNRNSLDALSGTWSKRAWTHQEEALSIRKILFSSSQVTFSCPSFEISETAQAKDDPNYGNIHYVMARYRDSDEKNELYDIWYAIALAHSERNITFQSDKLPTLSGMAKLYADTAADEYLAGLWASDLHCGLLWHLSQSSQTLESIIDRPPSAPYVGPSWSWISHEGQACWYYWRPPLTEDYDIRSEYKHIEGRCLPEDGEANPFGRLVDASMTVESKVVFPGAQRASLLLDRPETSSIYLHFAENYKMVCDLDWKPDGDIDETITTRLFLLLLSSTAVDDPYCMDPSSYPAEMAGSEDPATDADTADLKARLENSDEESRKEEKLERNAWGIILYPKEGTDKFYRVGRFSCAAADGGLRAFDNAEIKRVEIV
ncbi:HET-domain-containing protein [Lophiostoma macrostomum CBS 122681]|uniref:HET-domain-containing protein n=1 Tax=Lophiostoma macrostomum CBS 122681 TaxID=1314788 RepID=A0A6A6SWF6_9PLEO|nr:HET-domain-containing protein [Lophiostoma macrostomum CBS 122681]